VRLSIRIPAVALSFMVLAINPGFAAASDPARLVDAPGSVPPVVADGPIVLPNGHVLRAAPAGAPSRSVMAEMLSQHEHDRLVFTPGQRPVPLGRAQGTTTLAQVGQSHAILLPLAQADQTPSAQLASLPSHLRKQVFGFLPYWTLSATDLQWMRYGLVSTIAYFGVAARSDGSLATTSTGWNGWNSSAMTGVINAAHAKGAKVVVTITMMAWDSASRQAQATLLGNATYRARLVNNIVATVRARSADGVNLDFEPVSTTLRAQYTSFVRQLKAGLVAAGVGSSLTVCTMAGAATWSTGYDVPGLTATGAADALFVMGYDYSWSGSSRAGGVAPMSSPYMLDVNESVTDYLSETSGAKVIWGVPYYGRTWLTTSNALNATTVSGASGKSKAYYYTGATQLAGQYGRRWDGVGQVPWFVHYDSTQAHWVEGYYDDAVSLGAKYDMVNRRGLAGIGVWHLLMDEGTSTLWNLISAKFQTDTSPPSGGITLLPPATDSYAIPVSWLAIDPGSGVASYTVQVHDRATTTWSRWLAGTTATHAFYIGTPGHRYEFRVSAVDRKGNAQAWRPAAPDPGASLTVGGFAKVVASLVNVRSGADTSFSVLDQLVAGDRIRLLAGPFSGSGYTWYQVHFDFAQWPSADYPRTGWVAAGDANGPYLVPIQAPTITQVAPVIGSYAVAPRFISPNGDGVADATSVGYALPSAATSVRLDVLNAAGSVVDSTVLGGQASGAHHVSWDGRLAAGAVAPSGTYMLRVTVVDASGTHIAPTPTANSTTLGRWGVAVDLSPPTATTRTPTGPWLETAVAPRATFSEPVVGVSGSTMTLYDITAGRAVPATVTYEAVTRRATIQPSSRLAAGHGYRVSLGGISDRAGNRMASTSWTFSTAPTVIIYSPAARIVFLAGSITGYKFDASGTVTATKSATLSRASGASASQRRMIIPGHSGAWYRITDGIWAGYWVPESPRAYLPGFSYRVIFAAARKVTFSAGTYTAYRFDTSGHVTSSRRASLPRTSGAAATSRAVINGRAYVAIMNGIWAGYWMPLGGGVALN
jgi:spore germination protein YaaH